MKRSRDFLRNWLHPANVQPQHPTTVEGTAVAGCSTDPVAVVGAAAEAAVALGGAGATTVDVRVGDVQLHAEFPPKAEPRPASPSLTREPGPARSASPSLTRVPGPARSTSPTRKRPRERPPPLYECTPLPPVKRGRNAKTEKRVTDEMLTQMPAYEPKMVLPYSRVAHIGEEANRGLEEAFGDCPEMLALLGASNCGDLLEAVVRAWRVKVGRNKGFQVHDATGSKRKNGVENGQNSTGCDWNEVDDADGAVVRVECKSASPYEKRSYELGTPAVATQNILKKFWLADCPYIAHIPFAS